MPTTHNKKPWKSILDFPELRKTLTPEQLATYQSAHPSAKELEAIASNALRYAKGTSQDVQVTCPECNSSRCFIRRDNGLYHCWSCGNLRGQLRELRHRPHPEGDAIDSSYYTHAREKKQQDHDYVPMIASDYEEIDAATKTWLYPIYPLSPDQQALLEQEMRPQQVLQTDGKARRPLISTELASLQARVQAYLDDMGISQLYAEQEQLMCAYLYVSHDDSKSEDPQAVEEVPALAYCNRLYGKIVNVKFRAVKKDALTGAYSKVFTQVSPTKPCAPYGIDSINPMRGNAQPIQQLLFTEGEKDRLTLLQCGFPYVLSIANGAATDLDKSSEAFDSWIDQADEIIVCGDTDRPGRKLVRRLLDKYGDKARLAELPQGYKDISEVYAQFGAKVVRNIILSSQMMNNDEVYRAADHPDEILDILKGNYDHGYPIGMGELTDHVFHPTSDGGLIIVTGIPNSGKTDFLNCLMAHAMFHCKKRVAFLSFELPNKAKHFRTLAKIALGEEDIDRCPDSTLKSLITYLGSHMVDFKIENRLPTPSHIINLAKQEKRKNGLDFLVIDPYVFIDVNEGNARASETEQVKTMLTLIQSWSRTQGVWTVVVAHPRIQHKDGTTDFAPLDIYAASGSAHWANLADFFFSVKRVNNPDEGKVYSIVDMLKVRDQEFCHPGKVYYARQPCGRYDERESEQDCIDETLRGKILPRDEESWF